MKATLIGSLKAAMLAAALIVAAFGTSQAQSEFPQAKLEAFVAANLALRTVIEEWAPKIQNAESEAQADQMRQEANAAMIAVVEETDGITLDEFNEIGMAARSSPELESQIDQIFKEKLGN